MRCDTPHLTLHAAHSPFVIPANVGIQYLQHVSRSPPTGITANVQYEKSLMLFGLFLDELYWKILHPTLQIPGIDLYSKQGLATDFADPCCSVSKKSPTVFW